MRQVSLLTGYVLLAVIAAVQQWALPTPDDQYTHYNNYVIYKQSYFHLIGDQKLYAPHLAEHWDYFRYSPTFALAFGALAWMPDLAGLILWNTLNAAALFLAWATLPLRDERGSAVWLTGWFVAVEMMTALQNVQSNVLIAGLLILAFNSLERRRTGLAALTLAVAAFIKPFGLIGFGLIALYPEKKRFALSSAAWIVGLALLPLIVVTPGELVRLYGGWGERLAADFEQATGLSVMGWLQVWFGATPPKEIVVLAGLAVLWLPVAIAPRFHEFTYRLLVLCSILVWVVIFNHKAESSTYIIAMCGVALWFFAQRKRWTNIALVLLAFVFTSLSATEVFPRFLQAGVLVPYAIKAVPCIAIWLKITHELLTGCYQPAVAPTEA